MTSTVIIPQALQPNYGSSMGKDDENKVDGVNRCYTYISRCGVHAGCGSGGTCSGGGKECTQGNSNDFQYMSQSHCGGLHTPPKQEHHCSRVCDDTCPPIGGFVPSVDDRKFISSGSLWAHCPYTLGDIQTEDDMNTWLNNFPNSNSNNAQIYGTQVIPYYCGIGNNIIKGPGVNGASGSCQTFCNGQWNSNTQCAAALQTFCAQGDNAINNDLCYSACNSPAADGKPSWCDAQITSVCALVDTQSGVQVEGFSGVTDITSLLVIVVIVFVLYRFSGI